MSNSEAQDVGRIFGGVLRRYRSEMNMSQEELAFRAGVDRTFVSRIERGLRQPTITTLIALGSAIGVSAAELVRDTEAELQRRNSANLRNE
jgi:transcriptional regulator with XRE-family HTH domain